MRRALVLLLLVLVPCAGAQSANETDPTLNESDFNSTVPADDTTYLNGTDANQTGADGNATGGNATGSGAAAGNGTADAGAPPSNGTAEADPALGSQDFNTSLPDEDTTYLDQNEPPPAGGSTTPATAPSDDPGSVQTPGPGFGLLVAGAALAALLLRRT